MKRIYFLLVILIGGITYSQIVTEKSPKGKWVVGGGLGLGFSNGFIIQAFPEVGYRINRVEFGALVGLNYQSYNGNGYYTEKYTSTMWAFGPYFVYMPTSQFFLKGQYQYYTGKWNWDNTSYLDTHYDESALWLGGGYQNRIAEHVYFRIGFMYNVLYDNNSSIFSSGFQPMFGISAGL